jgi:hypothetical protein
MSNTTDVPFRATMNLDVAGHKVLLTAGGDTVSEFQLRWAELAESAQQLIESFNLLAAAHTAAPLVAHAPAPVSAPPAPVADDPWAPTPSAAPPQVAPVPNCDHGQPMKLVPPGVSKKTGKPYPGFYACANPDRNSQCGKTYPAA